jgi:hypothetical protein
MAPLLLHAGAGRKWLDIDDPFDDPCAGRAWTRVAVIPHLPFTAGILAETPRIVISICADSAPGFMAPPR